MQEEWREIIEWPEHYISNQGRVKNKDKFMALCPAAKRHKYVYVYHSKATMKPRALSVHRLVARYFIPNPKNKPQVNHIDFNPLNNNVNNLEWCTAKENVQHTINKGRKVQYRGTQCPQSKLTEDVVRKIKTEIGTMTHKSIAKKYNTNYSNVAHIKRGTRWGHVKV